MIDIQLIVVLLLFVVAVAYLGRMIYKNVRKKSAGCGGQCKCGVDFNQINIQ